MKILVTGAAGKIGRAVARELLEHGHEIRALDQTALPEDLRPRVETVFADITNRVEMLRAAQGCDAVAHLAAIPNPMQDEENLFAVNVTGTLNIFAAAEANGIKRVAIASSCSAYGFAFAHKEFDPQYLPVDEAHPLAPQDLYGLSKQLNEQTAETYARRGLTAICLRFPMAIKFDSDHTLWRQRQLKRAFEHRSSDFWSYIAVEDAALAFRLALEKPLDGFHVLIATARDAFGKGDVREAVARHFPALAQGVKNLRPDATLYSSEQAREVLGFEAKCSWRDFPELAHDDDEE